MKTATMYYSCDNKDHLFESNSIMAKKSQKSMCKALEPNSVNHSLKPSQRKESNLSVKN